MNLVLPLLTLSSSASSSAFLSTSSARRHISASRCAGSMSGHGPFSNAARAAATARLTSSELASATRAISRPVAGSITAIDSLDFDSTHSPPISRRGPRFRKRATAGDGSGCRAISRCDASEAFTGSSSGEVQQQHPGRPGCVLHWTPMGPQKRPGRLNHQRPRIQPTAKSWRAVILCLSQHTAQPLVERWRAFTRPP